MMGCMDFFVLVSLERVNNIVILDNNIKNISRKNIVLQTKEHLN